MNSNDSRPEKRGGQALGHQPVRRGVDIVLVGLTVLCLLAYVPVFLLLPKIVASDSSLGYWSLKPMASVVMPIAASVVWLVRRGATRRSRIVWGLCITSSLLAAPFACVSAAVSVTDVQLVPH